MNSLLQYLFQSGINLAILYIIFWSFMRNDTSFKMSRIYLVLTVVISIILPLFNFRLTGESLSTNYVYMLETIVVTPDHIAESIYTNQNLNQLWWLIYLAGTGFFILRFLFQLLRLGLMILPVEIRRIGNLKIVCTKKVYSPFSFFNFIFIGDNITDKAQIERIIAHERVHIQQKHSIDLILLEILTIIQWFNPFVWLYKHRVKCLHEYLADQGVLSKGFNKTDYQQMLLDQTFGVQFNYLTNNFNHSLIKRRLIMMSKSKTNQLTFLKMGLILPLAIIISVVFSITFSGKVIAQEPQKDAPVSKEKATTKIDEKEDVVFTVVEKMPSFPGGEEARNKYMIENITYPPKARQEGIQGRVFVTFIVEKDGAVSNVKILRGIGGGCDEEAVRVISMMPKWNPGIQRGQPVRVQFNMPIHFALGDGEKKAKTGEESKEIIPPPSPEKK